MKSLKRIVTIFIVVTLLLVCENYAATGKITVSSSRVREESNTSSNIVTNVYKDDEVEILGEEGEWYKIKYNSKEGYVKKEFVKTVEAADTNTNTTSNTSTETPTTPDNSSSTLPANITLRGNTALRILPSFMSRNVSMLEAGKTLKTISELNNWVQVTDDTVVGWILKVKTDLSSEELPAEQPKEEPEEVKPETPTETPVENTAKLSNTTNTTNEVKQENTAADSSKENTTKNEVTNTTVDNTSSTDTSSTKTGKINVDTARVRKGASSTAEIIDGLDYGDKVTIISEEGDWYQIKSGNIEGYVNKQLITISTVTSRSMQEARDAIQVRTEDTTTIDQSKNEEVNKALAAANPPASAQGGSVVDFAKQFLGYPYVAAGKTPETGFDCSGFTRYVFMNFGVTLGGSAASQAGAGTEVPRDQLMPGDLLLFYDEGRTKIGHTGIYIGDGNFVHAANPSRGVVIDNLNTSSYYNPRFVCARRIV